MAQVLETLEIDLEQISLIAHKDFISSCRESFNSYGLMFSLWFSLDQGSSTHGPRGSLP